MEVQVEIEDDIFLECYHHLLEDDGNDIDFLYGSRDSGKSQFVAQKYIKLCLELPYFRCLLGRKNFNTIKDSQWQTIKDIVTEWELTDLFIFKTHPLEIECVNGNRFLARGFDDPQMIKSVRNPSHAWIEEGNQLTSDDWNILITSIRNEFVNTKIDVTFNPECEEDYETFWLYKDYFSHTGQLSFSNHITTTADDGKQYTINYRATHTTYNDNPYCKPQRKAIYERLKVTDPYYYEIYGKGLWARRKTGMEFYHLFNRDKHVKKTTYNPDLMLHLTLDFNAHPYMTLLIFQIEHRKIENRYRVSGLKEYCLEHPQNTTTGVCRAFKEDPVFKDHKRGIFYYGDYSGKKTDTRTTIDDYETLEAELKEYVDDQSNRVIFNEPVLMRRKFMQAILNGDTNIDFELDESMVQTITDFQYVKQGADGKKHKEKAKNSADIQYEKYGHPTDATEYLYTSAFSGLFETYKDKK